MERNSRGLIRGIVPAFTGWEGGNDEKSHDNLYQGQALNPVSLQNRNGQHYLPSMCKVGARVGKRYSKSSCSGFISSTGMITNCRLIE